VEGEYEGQGKGGLIILLSMSFCPTQDEALSYAGRAFVNRRIMACLPKQVFSRKWGRLYRGMYKWKKINKIKK